MALGPPILPCFCQNGQKGVYFLSQNSPAGGSKKGHGGPKITKKNRIASELLGLITLYLEKLSFWQAGTLWAASAWSLWYYLFFMKPDVAQMGDNLLKGVLALFLVILAPF